MKPTAAENFLKLPLVDPAWTNAETDQRGGHPAQDQELKGDAFGTMYVRHNGIWVPHRPDIEQFAGIPIPTAYKWATVDRRLVGNAGTAWALSGQMWLATIALPKGVPVTKSAMRFHTAGTSPTHEWMALYDSNGNKLAVSNDTGAAAHALTGLQGFTIAWTTTYAGLYYLGGVQVASAMSTLRGISSGGAADTPKLAVTGANATGLTDPASAPATLGTLSAQAFIPYMALG